MALKEFDAASGEKQPDDSSAPGEQHAPITFDLMPLDLIVHSPDNPRTATLNRSHFINLLDNKTQRAEIRKLLARVDPEARQLLIEKLGSETFADFLSSIHSQGVNQPLLLRSIPPERMEETSTPERQGGPRPTHEIIAGERRFWASRLAGHDTIPVMIKGMAKAAALEFQLVENLQREGLDPLEEAEGYQRLCELTGLSKEDIGSRIKKSRTYVYEQLQLLGLTEESKTALRSQALTLSHAKLLAGIADPKMQLKGLKAATEVQGDGRTMSVRAFREWMVTNLLLKLDHAPFDTRDMVLHPDCGACGDCPKRTHANRDIFAAFDGPDMCMDAKCYGQKASITVEKARQEASAQGMEIIVGTDAKRLMPSPYISDIKGYTRLDAKHDDGTGKLVPISKLLGKDGPTPILFVNPHNQERIKVLPTTTVGDALKKKGVVKDTPPKSNDKTVDKAVAKARAEADFEAAWRERAVQTTDAAIKNGAVGAFTAPVLRAIAGMLVESEMLYSVGPYLQKLWGLPEDSDMENVVRHVQAAPDTELGRFILDVMMTTELGSVSGQPAPLIDLIASQAGVDLEKVRRDVKAEQKAAAKEAASPPGANVQAAPQGSDAQDGGKPAAKNAAGGRGKRLTEAEAKSGIAEAMQEMGEPGGEVQWPKWLTEDHIARLLMSGITTLDLLADMTIDELVVQTGLSDDTAKAVITKAREGWFEKTPAAPSLELKQGVRAKVLPTATDKKAWVGQVGKVLGKAVDTTEKKWDLTFEGKKGGGCVRFSANDLQVVA